MSFKPTFAYLFRKSLKTFGLALLWVIFVLIGLPALIALIAGTLGSFSLEDELSAQFISIPLGCILFIYFAMNQESFNFLIQNGVGRRTYWLAKSAVAGIMVILSEVISFIYLYGVYTPLKVHQQFFNGVRVDVNGNDVASSLLAMLYGKFTGNAALDLILTSLVVIVGFAMLTALGMMIGSIMSLFSKRNQWLILAAIGIIVIFLIIMLGSGNLPAMHLAGFMKFVKFALGGAGVKSMYHFNPFIAMLSGIIFTAVLLYISKFFTLKLTAKAY